MFLFPLHWKPLNFIRSNRSLVLLRTVLDTCTPTKRSLCPISLSVWRFLPMCTWGYFTHKSNEKWEIGVGKNNSLIDRGILCLLLHQEKVYVDILEIKKKKKKSRFCFADLRNLILSNIILHSHCALNFFKVRKKLCGTQALQHVYPLVIKTDNCWTYHLSAAS